MVLEDGATKKATTSLLSFSSLDIPQTEIFWAKSILYPWIALDLSFHLVGVTFRVHNNFGC